MRPKRGELFKHYKGGIYQIIGYAKHTETEDKLICYKSFKDPTIWARPLEMFMGMVEVDGKQLQRFEKINVL